jgi:hypothetical protein
MKKNILSSYMLAALSILVIVSVLVFIVGITTSQELKASKFVEDRLKGRLNPAPFQNFKAPLSGIVALTFSHPELLELGPGKVEHPKEPLKLQPPNYPYFNREIDNLHQNEPSVAVWKHPTTGVIYVVGGANDYRGIPAFNLLPGVSGYYVSNTAGSSTLRDGALPPLIALSDQNENFAARSWGDPVVDVFKNNGTFFYSSLYIDTWKDISAIGLAKADYAKLTNLAILQPWTVTKVKADREWYYFHDKPWMTINNFPGTGYYGYIYVTWTAFGPSGSKIMMARVSQNPFVATIIWPYSNPVSGGQYWTQWSKVSVDSAGRVIVTWTEYDFSPTATPPYYKIRLWYRVFAPGGATALTPPMLIATLNKPVSFSYAAQGNEFRIPAMLWSEPAVVNGVPRLYLAYFDGRNGEYLYDFPQFAYADTSSNIDLWLRYIDNYYTTAPTISPEIPLENSPVIHGFFPTMSVNQLKNTLDIAWYETEGTYKHDYYVRYQRRSLSSPTTIISSTSIYASDPDAEVYFSPYGWFIGDYFTIRTLPEPTSYVFIHYNGNPRYVPPSYYWMPDGTIWRLGGNQHDNLLWRFTYT